MIFGRDQAKISQNTRKFVLFPPKKKHPKKLLIFEPNQANPAIWLKKLVSNTLSRYSAQFLQRTPNPLCMSHGAGQGTLNRNFDTVWRFFWRGPFLHGQGPQGPVKHILGSNEIGFINIYSNHRQLAPKVTTLHIIQ